ncbi:DUF4079 family protein [Myxococcota bacterium]|nr:DUF4079 family protein [Myxococcota bacterium]
MLVTLALAGVSLRTGNALRRARRAGGRRTPPMRTRHLRLAKPTVLLLVVGFVAGPISAVWLRGIGPFDTFHGLLGLLCTGLFVAVAAIGWKLEHGASRAFEAHALLATLAVLVAALAAVAGFVLLA